MSNTQPLNNFDPNAYWLKRGERYRFEDRFSGPIVRQQEEFILRTVAEFKPKSIVEAGCGFGRVTRVLADAFPECRILGLDLSSGQIKNAEEYCPSRNVQFKQWDLRQDMPLPKADLVISIEVLLHHPDDVIRQMLGRMQAAAPVVIHDFDLTPPHPESYHVFWHDYSEIYKDMPVAIQRRYTRDHSLIVARSISGIPPMDIQ